MTIGVKQTHGLDLDSSNAMASRTDANYYYVIIIYFFSLNLSVKIRP